MKPLAPKTLLQNRYHIIKIIGKGGMGEVYLATDTRLGNEVALKRTTVGDDSNLAAAFEQEARTLAGLRHPVLPKVSDHFLENEEQFLVMDFIEGEDLSQRLKTSGQPFPLSWVLFWADELLEALAYLHTHQPPIIHRDIKPQNLKLTKDNHVVLLDFGLSKNSLGNTRVTTSGSVVGYTPHYAPMEQIRGTGTNAKSDLYALSATLYQLLTNSVPPDALTRADSVLSNLPDPLRSLTELNGEISETLAGAIKKGMAISQDKRFLDAREMQKALRRAYGSMQESMAAETVAFNMGDSEDTSGLSDSELKTQVGMEFPIVTNPGRTEEKETVTPAVPVPQAPVDPAGDEPALMSESEHAVPGEPEPSAPASEAVATEDPQAGGDEPELVAEEPAAQIEEVEEAASGTGNDSVETATPQQFRDANEDSEIETGVPGAVGAAAPPPKAKVKSSTGKYVAIFLVVAALAIVVLGSAAGGLWYYTQGGFSTGNENAAEPTPGTDSGVEDPQATEPTPGEANVNAENSELPNSNVNAEEAPSPTVDKTPGGTVPQTKPTVRRTPAAKPPVNKPPLRKPPAAKPTPRKKKDPGVI